MVPMARLRPRGMTERLAVGGGAIVGGARFLARLVASAVAVAFGV